MRPRLAVMLMLSSVTVALYWRASHFPFSLLDDGDYVIENARVTSGLSIDSIKWAFTAFHASNWHPVTWLSLMADSALFGVTPRGYHVVNIVLHALNAGLLFLLFAWMTGTLWRSAFVAACFALHPLHVESVVWISERKDVLSTFFLMLTLLLYTDYVKNSRPGRYVLSLAAFGLGLMAKPMLVTVPALLLLLDFWPFGRLKTGRLALPDAEPDPGTGSRRLGFLLLEKIPFLMLSAAASVLTLYAQQRGGSLTPLTEMPFPLRVNNALWSVAAYLRKTILPFDLAVFYPFSPVPVWKAGCALLLIGVVSCLSLMRMRRYPWLATGWFWYLITLVPVIGLVQVGRQAMADRYTYIPLIGLFTLASWGGAELATRLPKPRIAVGLIAAAALLLSSIGTWVQLGYWRNDLTLLNHALSITHDRATSHYVHFCLGASYEKQGQTETAIAQYREALQDDPDDARNHSALGNLLTNQGKVEEALNHLDRAVLLNPRLAKAHYNRGVALTAIGRVDEAIREYKETLAIEPADARCQNNIGVLLAQQGMLDEAVRHFSQAMRLNPGDAKAGANLQMALKLKDQAPLR